MSEKQYLKNQLPVILINLLEGYGSDNPGANAHVR